MAYTKRAWLGRQGTGLNKFSIGGATPVTIVNQPDSVTQVGDALSAGNLNDLEDRIEDAFDDVDTALDTKADEQDVTNLNNAINQLDHRLENIEQSKGDYVVSSYKDGSTTPSGKGKWCVVEGVEGVSRVENGLAYPMTDSTKYNFVNSTGSMADGVATFTASSFRGGWGQSTSFKTLPSMGGRTVLIALDIKTTTATTDVRLYAYGGYATKNCVASTAWQTVMMLVNVDASWPEYDRVNNRLLVEDTRQSGWDAIQTKNLVMCDLTVYFAGDPSVNVSSLTIADIQRDYPHLLLPSDYGTRIVDWTGNGVRAWARNLVDPSALTFGKYIDDQSGTLQGNDPIYCASGWMDVRGGETYYYMTSASAWGAWYDENKVYISGFTGVNTHTAPSNARFARVSGRTATYETTLCFNKSDSINGTFTPYFAPNTLSFPSTTLKSAGSVREKKLLNVEVEIDGQKVQKSVKTNPLGSYTFTGNETWGFYASPDNRFFFGGLSDVIKKIPVTELGNVLLEGFTPQTADRQYSQHNEYSVATDNLGRVFIYVASWVGKTSAEVASLMAGKTFYFELATPDPPTYSDPILDNTLLTESGGRMATVQTGTIVDGIADLGFITL